MQKADPICPICTGSRWVCENHPRLSWPKECNCGAGMPCPVCNVGEPPAMGPTFEPDEDAEVNEGDVTSPARFWAALNLVRVALESVAPPGVLPSKEAVLKLYGPEPVHEGEALAKAVIEMAERLHR
jgi:hypothetical protein